MKPITRKEYYLAKAAGTYTGPTPPPVLREDYYLATLAGDYSGYCPAPVTRLEKYMSAAAGLTSYVPQPVTRLEMYWYNIAKGTGYVPEPATREEQLLYAIIHKEPQYIDKTAEGSTILLTDSAEASFTALTLYGHSTQSGTPSPDNPVPIVSAGSVMTTGAQLFDIKKATPRGSAYGLTVSIDGEEIKISGTVSSVPDDGSALAFRILNYPENLYGNTFSADIVDDTGVQDCNVYGSQSENTIAIAIRRIPIGTEVNLVFRLMVNSGSTALPWEPYTGGVPGVNPYAGEINVSVSDGGTQSQTLTLSIPGGLPGIPVDSGGNYTDESGQQWIADVKDYGTGKYTQNIGQIASYNGEGVGDVWMSSTGQLTTGANVIYQLATPIVTDISAEEIAAYKALHTYTPNTSVGNDAAAWMKVGYKATP